jgi:hypothetical protein
MADRIAGAFPDMLLRIELGTTERKMQGLKTWMGRQ